MVKNAIIVILCLAGFLYSCQKQIDVTFNESDNKSRIELEQTDFISRDIINLKEEDAQKIALLFLKKR